MRGSLPAWGMTFQPSCRVRLALPLEREINCTNIHYPQTLSHDMHHSQESSTIIKEAILIIGFVYLHNGGILSANDLVP